MLLSFLASFLSLLIFSPNSSATTFSEVVEIGVSNLSKTLKIFNAIPIIKQIKTNTESKTINCVIRNASVNIPDIINKLSESNIQITKLNISPANLDDVFLKITGNNIKLEETSDE